MKIRTRLSLSRALSAVALCGAFLVACGDGAGSGSGSSASGIAIEQQPQSLLVKEGEPAMFNVARAIGAEGAAAAPLRYQWRRNGVDMAGADKDFVMIDRSGNTDDGAQYSVVISHDAASTESRVAVLGVVSEATELPWR